MKCINPTRDTSVITINIDGATTKPLLQLTFIPRVTPFSVMEAQVVAELPVALATGVPVQVVSVDEY